MILLFWILLMGPQTELKLETHDFYPIYGVVPYNDSFLVPHLGIRANHFHSFSKEGKWQNVFGQTGQGPGDFDGALMPNFDQENQQWLIIDLFRSQMKTFDIDGKYIKTQDMPPGLHFAEEGILSKTEQGFIFLTDSYKEEFLLVATDKKLNIQKVAHRVFDLRVPELDSQAYRGFLLEHEGRLFVLESLRPGWTIYDKKLNKINEVKIKIPYWQQADLDEVKQISYEDFKLEHHFDLYSEIRFAKIVSGKMLLGVRRPEKAGYTYYTFELSGVANGDPFDTTHQLIGATEDEAIFTDPDADDMSVFFVPVQKKK